MRRLLNLINKMESNLFLENLSRRDFLTASALTGLSLFGLNELKAQATNSKTKKQKTPEDYGIKMFSEYDVGSFLCTEILDDPKLKGLDCFKGINKGLTFRLNEEGELKVFQGPVYEEKDSLYLVIYNPERKNHRLGFNISRVIEESGIKFIDEKAYEVKLKRGKIVERRPLDSEFEKEGLFYDLYMKKMDVILATDSEEAIRKGPFELNGTHRAFQLGKLGIGDYSATLETHKGDGTDGCIPLFHFKIW